MLALLLRVRRVPADISGIVLEPIRHEDFVLVVLIARGEDIGALDGLGEVAEDVEDEEESFGCIFWAGDVLVVVLVEVNSM